MRQLEGLAVPYDVAAPIGDRSGAVAFIETIAPGCFADAKPGLPLMSWHERQIFPLGVIDELHEEDDGLHLTATLTSGSRHAGDAWAHIRDGSLGALSVGFKPVVSDWCMGTDGSPTTVRRVRAQLVEVSVVPVPAYPSARISKRTDSDAATPHADELVNWLVGARRPAYAR